MPARDASNREQKALLIGRAGPCHPGRRMTGIVPLLLLDEVVAHLDPVRRKALFDELAKLGAQVWMTARTRRRSPIVGASSEIFDVESGEPDPAWLRAANRVAPQIRGVQKAGL